MRLESLLQNSAQRTADAIAAIEPEGRSISYQDLEGYAATIHSALEICGVAPGDRVGLCIAKTIDTLASVFGVLKAGAAYVPVDYSSPPSRNAYVFDNCAANAIVVEPDRADALEAELDGTWSRHTFPSHGENAPGYVVLVPERRRESNATVPTDLAYILYTSGSTGRPKGVMHSHSAALAFIDWCSEELQPIAMDRFSSHAPFHFDLSILDIYLSIKHGASVVLIGSEVGKQPRTLAEIIEAQRITIWYSTPSILRMLVEYGDLASIDASSLRTVIFAGEVFPIKHLRNLMKTLPEPTYYNFYGPTETNVCTYYRVERQLEPDRATPLPIGKVCSGDLLLVIDDDGCVVGPSERGELIATGGSVMLGYWNNPERNAKAFVSINGEKWYRTGDIVRQDETGDYIYVGRRDRMVKRLGYRVELGEIEAAINRHPSISEAAVIANSNDDGDTSILAFVSWSDEQPFSVLRMKQFCAQYIPLYMMPNEFKTLESLPKTSTDKLDYQRLKDLI